MRREEHKQALAEKKPISQSQGPLEELKDSKPSLNFNVGKPAQLNSDGIQPRSNTPRFDYIKHPDSNANSFYKGSMRYQQAASDYNVNQRNLSIEKEISSSNRISNSLNSLDKKAMMQDRMHHDIRNEKNLNSSLIPMSDKSSKRRVNNE